MQCREWGAGAGGCHAARARTHALPTLASELQTTLPKSVATANEAAGEWAPRGGGVGEVAASAHLSAKSRHTRMVAVLFVVKAS